MRAHVEEWVLVRQILHRPDVRLVRLSEVVGALTHVLDIAEGQPEGHAMRTCVIGMGVANELGLDDAQKSDLYYALLLKDLGCSSNSAQISELFGADDLTVKRSFKVHDLDAAGDGIRFVLSTAGSAAPLHQRLKHVWNVSVGGETRELFELRSERGASIAREIGLSAATSEGIRALDEHWDGRGHPYGLAGAQIPLHARIVGLAQTVEVFTARWGAYAARGMARDRAGTWFDPAVVAAFERVQAKPGFWEDVEGPDPACVVSALEPADRVATADEERLDRIAEAFARVIDAKSPWTWCHSTRVRDLAVGAAHALHAAPDAVRALGRAALLHDLGKLAVSNRILDKQSRLTDAELAAVRTHPAHTQHILERIAPFAEFAELAGAHHERLDGNGYHRGVGGFELTEEARVLAVADRYEALTAHRPYREGMPPERAMEILWDDAGIGVCTDAVEALEAFLESPAGTALSRPATPEDAPT